MRITMKGKARRVIVVGAGLALLGSSLAACSSDGDGGSSGGKTTITMLSWTNEEIMGAMVDAFEADNPDIKVEFTYSPPVADYIQALQTKILSGTAPDVFMLAAENKTNLIQGKNVLDLTDEPFMANIADFNRETYSSDGHVYGMSVASWGSGLMYNKKLLGQVGAEEPPATWDEFLQLCKDLKAAGIDPYMEFVQDVPGIVSAFLGAENKSMGGTMDKEIFAGENTFEATWTEPLTQWSRTWDEGIQSRDSVGITGDQVRDEFINERVAMIVTGPWDLAGIREGNPDLDFEMALIPAAPGGEQFQAGAAEPGYAINSASKNIDAAKKFLTFLGSPKGVQIFNEKAKAVTTTTDFDPEIDPAMEGVVDNIRAGNLYLPMISWERCEDVLQVEATAQLQLVVQQQATPEQAASALDTKLANCG